MSRGEEEERKERRGGMWRAEIMFGGKVLPYCSRADERRGRKRGEMKKREKKEEGKTVEGKCAVKQRQSENHSGRQPENKRK